MGIQKNSDNNQSNDNDFSLLKVYDEAFNYAFCYISVSESAFSDFNSVRILESFSEFVYQISKVKSAPEIIIESDASILEILIPVLSASASIVWSLRKLDDSEIGEFIARSAHSETRFALAIEQLEQCESQSEVRFGIFEYSNCMREALSVTSEYAMRHNIQLVALQVNTLEAHLDCQSKRVPFSHGSFYEGNLQTADQPLSADGSRLMALLQMLSDPDISNSEIIDAMAPQAELVRRVISISNAVAERKVQSIDDLARALVWIGIDKLKGLISVMLMLSLSPPPKHLVTQSLIRAYMCESLFNESDELRGTAFLVGLVSNMDRILNIPMSRLLAELKLSERCVEAVMSYSGELGEMLKTVIKFSDGDWAIHDAEITVYLFDVYVDALEKAIITIDSQPH